MMQNRGKSAAMTARSGPLDGLYHVGLTGGIGTGKSTVSGYLAEKGLYRVDADAAARAVLTEVPEILIALRRRYGDGIFDVSGALDRRALGAVVFSDAAERAWLNAEMHPHIRAHMTALYGRRAAEMTAHEKRQSAVSQTPLAYVVVSDIPLLFESEAALDSASEVQGTSAHAAAPWGFHERVLVYAPEALCYARIRSRDGLSPDEAHARIRAQMSIEEKRRRADYIIENTRTLSALYASADAYVHALERRVKAWLEHGGASF